MKRVALPLVLAAVLAACDADPRVVVRVSIDGRPLADVPVRLLPYDRQAVLDSLSGAADAEEPPVPQDLLQRLGALDAEEARARGRGDSAVARVAAERRRLQLWGDSVRALRRAWNDSVFRDFDKVADQRVTAAGLRVATDTTDASGTALLEAGEGDWWVSLQYVLSDEELDWNIPLTVGERSDSIVVTLTRENATVKPYF